MTATPSEQQRYLSSTSMQSHATQRQSSRNGEGCDPEIVELRRAIKYAKAENSLILEHLFDLQEEHQQQAVLAQETGKQLLILKEKLHKLNEEKQRVSIELNNSLSQIQEQKVKIENLSHEKIRITRDHEASTLCSLQLMQSLKNENDLLLSHFLGTQEELERQTILDLNTPPKANGQWRSSKGSLEHDSIRSTFSNVQVRTIPKNPESATEWRFNDICLGNEHVGSLHFITTLHDNLASIAFLRSDTRSPTPFIRWPTQLVEDHILYCAPEKGKVLHGQNAVLSRLGNRDWKILNLLVQHLIALLGTPVNTILPETLDKPALKSGLMTLKKTLEKWPLVLRYDNIILLDAKEAGSYRYLDLLLENVTLGSEKWPQLEYRLATSDSEHHLFGQTPHLDFTKTANSVLKSQFDERDILHSRPLELQLSSLNVKDNRAWSQLVAQDQILITWLVTTLPFQLADLQQTGAEISLDWTRVISTMREALTEYATAHHAPSAN